MFLFLLHVVFESVQLGVEELELLAVSGRLSVVVGGARTQGEDIVVVSTRPAVRPSQAVLPRPLPRPLQLLSPNQYVVVVKLGLFWSTYITDDYWHCSLLPWWLLLSVVFSVVLSESVLSGEGVLSEHISDQNLRWCGRESCPGGRPDHRQLHSTA